MAWIKVTNEVREAAQRLLIRHNEAEKARAEKRYQDELARTKSWARELGRGVNKAYIRERAACELPADKDLRQRLEAVAHGKRKLIDVGWWRKVHGDVNRKLVEKIAALADPARNPSEHERKVAEAKLKAAKARRTPGMPPEPLPLPVNLSEWTRKGKTKSPPPPSSRRLSAVSDSVATPPVQPHTSASVAKQGMSDSVARLKALNKQRAAKRAAKRTNLKCQSCGKPLAAQRVTARYCNATCRSHAWRKAHSRR